jgi:hypothetical protein
MRITNPNMNITITSSAPGTLTWITVPSQVVAMGIFVLVTLAIYAIIRASNFFRINQRPGEVRLDFSNICPTINIDHNMVEPHIYRPWKAGKYNMTMGIRKMPADEWLTVDKLYTQEQKFKEQLLEKDIGAVMQCLPDAYEACIETLECVVGFLTRRYPGYFYLPKNQPGYVYNAITKRKFRIVEPFEQHPLVVAAQLAMEDINLLLRGSGEDSKDYNL